MEKITENNKVIAEGDTVSFTYYTESDKCVTGIGTVVWANEHDIVVQGKRKRHMMQLSAINTNHPNNGKG